MKTLLFNAARADHLDDVIRPALAVGSWVICDRFMDSTRAYQGAGGRARDGDVEMLERRVVGDTAPDLTLVLDLDPATGLARARQRAAHVAPEAGTDAFEMRDLAFHQRLRQAYRDIALTEPARVVLVDAARDIAAIAADVRGLVTSRLAPSVA